MLTEGEKSMCKCLGMSERTFALGKADQAPVEAAGGDEVPDVGQLNAAALAVLTAEERAMCKRLGLTPATFLLGKLSQADYEAIVNAANSGAGNAVALAMQAVRTADAGRPAGELVLNDGPHLIGPAVPLV